MSILELKAIELRKRDSLETVCRKTPEEIGAQIEYAVLLFELRKTKLNLAIRTFSTIKPTEDIEYAKSNVKDCRINFQISRVFLELLSCEQEIASFATSVDLENHLKKYGKKCAEWDELRLKYLQIYRKWKPND